MNSQARILVVDSEPATRAVIRDHLSGGRFIVREAACTGEAEQEILLRRPDLLLLDWTLPGKSGIDYVKELRKAPFTREIGIILVTARDTEEEKISALEAGADDYLSRNYLPSDLILRVRTLLRRLQPVRLDTPVEIDGLRLDPNTHEVKGDGRLIKLGPTEFRMLHFLMNHRERVYTRQDLLHHIWGVEEVVRERTVDVHIRRLRSALSRTGHDRLIHTVRGTGYRLSESTTV